jgi:hypothetical protein
MFRIKILHRRNHPFTNKIKVYGVSIEAILIGFFILIVFFLSAVYFSRRHKKEINSSYVSSLDVQTKTI